MEGFDVDEFLACARYGEFDDLKTLAEDYLSKNTESRVFAAIGGYGKNTALHMASANGHKDIVEYLLPKLTPLEINIKNAEGSTALHWAALNGHKDICEMLVKSGADPKIMNNGGRDCIYEAQSRDHEDIVMMLLRMTEPDVDEENTDEVVEDQTASGSSTAATGIVPKEKIIKVNQDGFTYDDRRAGKEEQPER